MNLLYWAEPPSSLPSSKNCINLRHLTVVFCALVILLVGPAEAKWVWVQQQNFKSLEKLNVNSDRLLSIYSRLSFELLKTETLVTSIYGSNFREFVFEIPDEIATDKLLKPILNRIYSQVADGFSRYVEPPIGSENWLEWLKGGMRFGFGQSPEIAFVNMKLASFNMTYGQWLDQAQQLRGRLRDLSDKNDIAWIDILEASRRYGRDVAQMNSWLASRSVSSSWGIAISEYGKLLTLADFLDPRRYRPNNVEIAKLAQDISWKFLLVIDVRGLGTTNREAQDQWLEQGARIEAIGGVSDPGDRRLTEVYNRVQLMLKKFPLLQIVGSYEVGDSIVIGLRNGSKNEYIDLTNKLSMFNDIHSVLVERSGGNLQKVLQRASVELKSPEKNLCRGLFSI